MIRALLALAILLVGCGGKPIYDKQKTTVGEIQETYAPGLCSFTTASTSKDRQWIWNQPTCSWRAPCDSFRVGDTVWLEIHRSKPVVVTP